MPEQTLDELVLKLSADVGGLTAGFAQVVEESKKTAEKSEGHLKKMSQGFDQLKVAVLSVAAAIGIDLGVRAFKEMIMGSIEAIDAMVNLSDKTNIEIKSLYAMKVLADDVGVSFESLTGTITKMERIISNATRGTNAATKALDELGLNAQELKKMKPEEAFFKISDALGAVANHADRTRLSMVLLGRGGAELANVIKAGSKGFEEAKKTAEDLGYALDRVDAQKVAHAKDQLELVDSAIKAVGQHVAVELSPYIEEVAKQIVAAAKETHGFKDTIMELVETGVKGVGFLMDTWWGLKVVWAGLKVAFAQFTEWVWIGIDKIVQGIVASVTVIGNVFSALWETAKSGQAGFEVMWGAIKKVSMEGIAFIALKMGDWLHTLADSLDRIAPAMAEQMRAAAFKIGQNFGTMAVDADKAFDKIKDDAIKQGQATKDAWKNVFNVAEATDKAHTLVNALGLENATMLLNDAKLNLKEILSTGAPGHALLDWLAEVKAKAEAAAEEVAKTAPGGENHDNGNDDEVTAYQAMLQGKLDALGIYQDADLIKEAQWYQDNQNLLQAAKEQGLLTEAESQVALEDLNKRHTARINALDKEAGRQNAAIWAASWQGKAMLLGQIMQSMSVMMQSKSRAMFEVGKAAAYASTIINTASAAMGAYNAYASIPYVGPVLGAAAAAAAVAAGAIQLSTISSTSFGGGGSVGGSFSASAPSGGGASLAQSGGATNPTANGVSQTAPLPTDITINIKGKDGPTKQELMDLSEELDKLKNDGVVIGRLKFV